MELRYILTKATGLAKSLRYKEPVSLYKGSFPYILLLLGQKFSFVLPRTMLIEVRYIEVPQ